MSTDCIYSGMGCIHSGTISKSIQQVARSGDHNKKCAWATVRGKGWVDHEHRQGWVGTNKKVSNAGKGSMDQRVHAQINKAVWLKSRKADTKRQCKQGVT